MNWETQRLLELAGIKRRRTPDSLLLTEGEDEEPAADEDEEDDLFGDSDDDAAADDDDGGDEDKSEDEEAPGSNREAPEELEAKDIERFGSPRFLDLENNLQRMFNDAWASAGAAAQNIEAYPGNAIEEEPSTPAKEESPEKDEKNESFYRSKNKRDQWLVTEASRLLVEADIEGSAADEFDMERFCTDLANYLDNIHNTEDIEGSIFNSARQMILNNFGKQTDAEFVDMLAAVTDNKWDFLGTHQEINQVHLAVGASSDAAGA